MARLSTALLIVGLQNDYCSGGARGVPGGERVAAPLSCVANAIEHGGGLVVALREWHSQASPWFHPNGGEHAPFCVAGSEGAAFHRDLHLSRRSRQVFRTDDPASGATAFRGRDRTGRPLVELLREAGARRLFLGGIPTETGIRETALDALRKGFDVTVIQDGVAAMNPAAGRGVLTDLRWAGAQVAGSGQAIMALYTSGQIHD